MNPPPVMWAQRHGLVFLTVCLEDCKSPEIRIENDRVYFKGIGGTDKKEHEVTIELYKEIDTEVRTLYFMCAESYDMCLFSCINDHI